jgi:AcrR family transcriptional regulator
MQADRPEQQLKKKLRQVRTEQILDAAEEILAEKGYHESSIDEIAARSGMSKGTLYQHFLRKEDLFVAIFERGLQLFEQMVQLVAASDLPAQTKLEQILLYVYKEQRGRHAQLFQLLAQQAEIRSSLREREGHLRGFLEQSTQQIRAILEEGKALGEFDETISTELMLLTFMHSLAQSKREQLFVREHLSPDELVRQIGQLLFHGFACKK